MMQVPTVPKMSPHRPHSKQWAFLVAARSGRFREIFFGGAGGGGKSDAMLMLALQDDWITDPGYSGLILRKTFPDLNQPEGILFRAKEWLIGQPGVEWQAMHNRFQFESGAVLQFGHCAGPNDHLKYRGGKYNLICWDELTDFSEQAYTYLFSRQRRPIGSKLPLLTVSASNPGGFGHAWVRNRLVKSKVPDRIFLPASYQDNPYLDQEQYGRTLDNLLPTERARIKHGDWDVVDGEFLFSRLWFKTVPELPTGGRISVRAWDCAATPGGGDWSVGLRMHKIGDKYYIDSVIRGQFKPSDLDRVQSETAQQDGTSVSVLLEREPGSAGKRVNQYVRQRLAGYHVVEESPSGDKYVRATPAARAASNGQIFMVAGNYVGTLLAEIETFTGTGGDGEHDDQVDALSLAFNYLNRKQGMAIL